jgi:hypothetical protein
MELAHTGTSFVIYDVTSHSRCIDHTAICTLVVSELQGTRYLFDKQRGNKPVGGCDV